MTKLVEKKTMLRFLREIGTGLDHYEGKKLFYHQIRDWLLKQHTLENKDPNFYRIKEMFEKK